MVAPPAETDGVAGTGFTVTATAPEANEEQPPFVAITVYEPLAVAE